MKTKTIVTVFYGLTAIGVGLWRHLQTGDSPQAVWFGLVMGSLAILGAVLLNFNKYLPGYLLILISLGFVGGWFLRRMLIGHPDGTSVRVILILLTCAVEVVVLLKPSPKENRSAKE